MAKTIRFSSRLGYLGNSSAIKAIPFGAVISPFGALSELDDVQHVEVVEDNISDLRCTSCGSFSTSIMRSPRMACTICGVTNVITTDHSKNPELTSQCVQVISSAASMEQSRSSLVFVIDTNLQPQELQNIHDSINKTIHSIGKNKVSLCLIVISRVVTVYRCCLDDVVSGDIFGSIDSVKSLQDHQINSYLSSATACLDTFLTSLLSIRGARKPSTLNQSSNPRRRKAVEFLPRNLVLAVKIALHLLTCNKKNTSGRIIVCLEGYPNVDHNGVSQPPLSISNTSSGDTAPLRDAHMAISFLAHEAVTTSVGIDIFCSGLQSLNAPLLYDLADPTGGIVLLQQSFSVNEFGANLNKMLSEQVMLNTLSVTPSLNDTESEVDQHCTLEVICSGAVKISHLGPASYDREDFKHCFKFRRFDPRATVSLYLECPPGDTKDIYIQFIAHTNVKNRNFRRISSFKIEKTIDDSLFLDSVDEEVVVVLLGKAACQHANDYSVGYPMDSMRLASCERLDSWLSEFVKYHAKGSKDIQAALPVSMSGCLARSLYGIRFGPLLGETHNVTNTSLSLILPMFYFMFTFLGI